MRKIKSQKKLMTIIGARPQFVKTAAVSRYLNSLKPKPFDEILVHTGQHYSINMSDIFFRELHIPKPKYNLCVGSHESPKQVGLMLEKLDEVIKNEKPDATLAYGDTNSTLAAAIVSTYRNIPFIHVEAGERTYRRHEVPEESNRVLSDHLAHLCFTATERAKDYLLREGMCHDRVKFVGDVMYDLFKFTTSSKLKSKISPASVGFKKGDYHLATIHRAENTNDKKRAILILNTLDSSKKLVVLPIHPRLANLIKQWGWKPKKNLKIFEPLGYYEFLAFLLDCDKCITDSGGVIRESFFASKPCIIPLENSWWVDLVEAGWATETGSDPKKLSDAIESFKIIKGAPKGIFGDGHSARKIVEEVADFINKNYSDGMWHHHGSFDDLPKSVPRAGAFSHDDYRNLLTTLKNNGYVFSSFDEAPIRLETNKPFVIMRHDVDMDLDSAFNIAKIEAKLGVKSTFFFLIRTPHYNIFSEEGTKKVSEILSLGHYLGLHFDCSSYSSMNAKNMAQACSKEASMLEKWFGKKVSILSYHKPDSRVLSGNSEISAPREHTYMPIYSKKIKYISDSTGQWKFGSPIELAEFRQKKPLHILVHPVWWSPRSLSAYETLLKMAQKKNYELEKSIARNCKIYRVGYFARMKYGD